MQLWVNIEHLNKSLTKHKWPMHMLLRATWKLERKMGVKLTTPQLVGLQSPQPTLQILTTAHLRFSVSNASAHLEMVVLGVERHKALSNWSI